MAIMALTVTAVEDATAEDNAAEPSVYSVAYLPHNPYEGAVASTSTNIIRAPGNLGHVAAFHKTVDTPFSSVYKSDVRYTNNVQPYRLATGPHPYAAGPYSYVGTAAGPYTYSPPPIKTHGYVPAGASPYGYGHAAVTPVVTPHSFSHASFAGPYGPYYSYRR